MKRIIIFAVILFAAVTFNAEAKRHYNGVGGYFYTELAPYGSWIEVDYGVVVWRPTIIRVNWMPYQMGSWVWTYDGWYWDSYEPFGFITYHYGRWYYDDYYGWLWYPDYEWAPAWVEWRYDNNYIGWAPLHPYATFSISIGIFWSNTYYSPYHHWNYVTYNYFCDPYVYNYYVEPGYKYRIHSGTKYRHDYGYRNGRVQNRGIDVSYISTRSGQKIKQRDIIRVNDSRELKRDGYGKRDEIRTLDVKREELVRNDLSRMEIKKENRRTSLDVEKVQIGRREGMTTGKSENKSKDRSLDVRNNDESRNDIKKGVDNIFEQNRTETKRNSDINENIRKKNDGSSRNENQIKEQRVKTNESVELNKKRQDQTTQIKRENTRVTNNDQVKRNEVKNNTRINTNESGELNKKKQEQTTQVKHENTRVTNNDQVKGNEVKNNTRINTNESGELNKKRQEQTTQVKRENTRVTNKDQIKKNEVKEQSRNTETKVKTDRTMEKDNSRERRRR